MKQEVYDRLAELGTARESMGAVVEKLIDEHCNKESQPVITMWRSVSQRRFRTPEEAGTYEVEHADSDYYEIESMDIKVEQ